MQQHPAVIWKYVVGTLKECRITLHFECFEGTDADNTVDLVRELIPALQPHLDAAFGGNFRQFRFAVLELIATERDTDDVHIVVLDRSLQPTTPAAANIEQRHPGLKMQLVQRQIELRVLRFFESHVLTLEVRAGVSHRGV